MIEYLALGDSYTIGEQVREEENFPRQTVDFLKKDHFLEIEEPRIIAQTGWTTDELMAAIKEQNPENKYDLVSLLIGVNNQYRGRSTKEYETEFTGLLTKAILLAEGRPGRVFVLSVPDWSFTPFAREKDRKAISAEIDAFNKIGRSVALDHQCHYLDITGSSRAHGSNVVFLTPDQLHYSGKEYKIWAQSLAALMKEALEKEPRITPG